MSRKKFDFSQAGKFPVTQENLEWMQKDHDEISKWPSFLAGVSPYQSIILSGCEYDEPTGVWSDGWISIDGEVLPFIGGGTHLGVEVVETAANVTFEGGIIKAVKLQRYAKQQTYGLPGLRIDQMPRFSDLLGAGAVVNKYFLSGSETISLGTIAGNAAGAINYRINKLTRTLHVDGTITFGSAQTISDPPLMFNLMTLAADFIPAKTQYFEAHYRYHNTTALFKDYAGNDVIRSLLCEINTSGLFNMGIIKPDAAITSYAVRFNAMLSLD